MAKFIRDEKRTYPFLWLTIGGIFAGSAAWAVYAELVTRVPWQKEQGAFYQMELEQARQSHERYKAEWEKEIEPSLKDKLGRKDEIEKSMVSGAYADAKRRLDELNKKFGEAELQKTFGGSDLDEAYYYRNLAEYERDAAAVAVRKAYQEAYATDPAKAQAETDRIYADPPAPPKGEGSGDKMHHLEAEIARMRAHIKQIDAAVAGAPSDAARKALATSKHFEQDVIEKLEVEIKHQIRVDKALAEMGKIDGPPEPTISEKDPKKQAAERAKARAAACAGKDDTRSCIKWIKLEPVDAELKTIEVEIAKRKRPLIDAELRLGKAETKAKPKLDVADVIHSLVGPFQIQQVVTSWIDYDRDVDKEQVDRCQTCHMGSDNGSYTATAIPKQFRTHPNRGVLFTVHPVEKFGCTSCHQGQGRATDMLSHSGWHLEKDPHTGKERWHFKGDHYWEDPLLPIGELTKVIVDDRNDTFEVKLGKGKWAKVTLTHANPEEHAKDKEAVKHEHYEEEKELFAELQTKLQELVKGEAKYHAVVRKDQNRVQIGVEQNDPNEKIPAKEALTIAVRFPKPELATMLGFNAAVETGGKASLLTASAPPSEPVRGPGMESWDKDGRYHPPNGEAGLQVTDEMRNRFIEALPEVESGCLRCHANDLDLRPRTSKAKHVASKLQYEREEAWKKKDPEGYKKAKDGADDLPAVHPDPAASEDLAPTYSEGRALFRKLNCTGCHILDNFPWDRNAGPSLDNVTAKVSPEWLLTWVRYPRGWRAKTRMPNFWPKPLDPASKRPLPPGSPEYEKWKTQMRDETVAIASFLVERSDNPSIRPGAAKDAKPLKDAVKGYADVPNATAEKGKVYFEAYGCQGCHARTDADTGDEKLPEPWRSRERDIAPTLANMGAKTTADWIAYWVEEPNRYWHGTKMPNLRLSREEAASIGKYVASLTSKPLAAVDVDKADTALVSDSAKRNEKVPCGAAGGAMLTRVECGEKLVGYYGCFGCHQVSGFEKYAPIAPELGGFAKKDVTTLDFGYAIADHHLQTTETFAALKLDSPRIYRRDRIELKMADFDLSPREIRSLVVFLKGLVPAKPKVAYAPDKHPAYAAALEGRQIVEDYNCQGCHLIEEQGAEINAFRTAQISADPQALAPYLGAEGARVQPEWLFGFLRDPGKKEHAIRPWLHPELAYGKEVPSDKLALRMPTFNFTPEQVTAIVRYFASWDGQEYPYQEPKVAELSEPQKLYALTHMNSPDAANCLSCHYVGEFPVERGKSELGKMAPNLAYVQKRLRPEWVKAWLLRPGNYLPYTKMTAFWATTDRPKEGLWPSESDPFLSPPGAWNKAPSPVNDITGEQQAEMVRDFLFQMPQGVPFPAVGSEADSPLVKKHLLDAPKAETDKDKKDKDKDKKDKKKPG